MARDRVAGSVLPTILVFRAMTGLVTLVISTTSAGEERACQVRLLLRFAAMFLLLSLLFF
jgi:hypothetical protein